MLKLWDKKRLDFSIKMSLVPLICFILMVSACSSGTNTTQSSGKEIPTGSGGPEEIILVNPDPAKITLDAPTDPARLTIHLPGVPVPLPKALQGYEIWRGP
jgi:hypothetical protein